MSTLEDVLAEAGITGVEISSDTASGQQVRPTIEFNAPPEVATLIFEKLDASTSNDTNLAVVHADKNGLYKSAKGLSKPRLWESVPGPDRNDLFAVYTASNGELRIPVLLGPGGGVRWLTFAGLIEDLQKDARKYNKSRVLITPHSGAADISVDDLSQEVARLIVDEVIPALHRVRKAREDEAYGMPFNAWPLSFTGRNPYFASGVALTGRRTSKAKKGNKKTTKKTTKKKTTKRTKKRSGKKTPRKGPGRKLGGAEHGAVMPQYGGVPWY
jgi:hypothetical protein